jgi:cytochrome c biogenesis protein CcdA
MATPAPQSHDPTSGNTSRRVAFFTACLGMAGLTVGWIPLMYVEAFLRQIFWEELPWFFKYLTTIGIIVSALMMLVGGVGLFVLDRRRAISPGDTEPLPPKPDAP